LLTIREARDWGLCGWPEGHSAIVQGRLGSNMGMGVFSHLRCEDFGYEVRLQI
jgi:hypothetical protein